MIRIVVGFFSFFLFSSTFAMASIDTNRHVIIMSWDGFGMNVFEKTSPLKNLDRLVKNGAFATNAAAIMPTSTLPNHASMISGQSPEAHGVTWNEWKPELSFLQVTNIFELAKKGSLTTALIAGKDKFKHFNKPGLINWFEVHSNAKTVAESAAKIIAAHKPNLIFIHFPDPDVAGHSSGWLSDEQVAAVKDCDEALKVVSDSLEAAGIQGQTSWIITADHGGHDKGHGTDQASDRKIPWILFGKDVPKGQKINRRIEATDTAAQAAWFLKLEVPKDWNWRGKAALPL